MFQSLDAPLRITNNAQLGDLLLLLDAPFDWPREMSPLQPKSRILVLTAHAERIAALETRVASLEAHTLQGRCRRLLSWLRQRLSHWSHGRL